MIFLNDITYQCLLDRYTQSITGMIKFDYFTSLIIDDNIKRLFSVDINKKSIKLMPGKELILYENLLDTNTITGHIFFCDEKEMIWYPLNTSFIFLNNKIIHINFPKNDKYNYISLYFLKDCLEYYGIKGNIISLTDIKGKIKLTTEEDVCMFIFYFNDFINTRIFD